MSRTNLDGLGYRGATVVLTGGASGMGEAAARLLGELGATVHIADLAEPKVACASYTRVDLSDPASVAAAATELGKLGPIDFLFPIAGVPPHAVGALTCMEINYAGTRRFTELLLPAVRDGGTVCLVTSTAARGWLHHLAENLEIVALDPLEVRAFYEAHPDKLRDGYSASKELLTVWIHQAAIGLAQERRVRLNGIAPCATGTPFMEQSAQHLGQAFMESYPHPLLGRMPSAEEQAWSLLLLSSPLNAAVTGAVLATDEGNVGGMITGALTPSYARQN
ncbi:SDR family oxidoreductase [Novosphingobium sp. JCM 18896]|uniref:SDR family oxidoreductase n=1 Tax=Novosphingobium sp. JCM 18896 TaxID=2989731 RepID=UPI002222DD3B|nr:SDR family oxidoreductase [Novosphingobium sp. JCM 18896]MCW1430964.1 SDR family oxidoreductase [Novosphingobium sp. JCM 18896]